MVGFSEHPITGYSAQACLIYLFHLKWLKWLGFGWNCPQRSIWFVFVSHFSCSISRCTHSFHLFRSLAQSGPKVSEYLQGSGDVPACSFPCSYIDLITQSLCVLPFSPHTSRDAETFLLDSKKIHSSNSGWLVFDTTATSNHWVMNPQQNLGLQLCVETADGKFECFLYSQDLCQSLGPEKRSQSTSETVQKPCMCD